jgi:hypothetical protein
VVNMSLGAQLVERRAVEVDGLRQPLTMVTRPALLEALARAFDGDDMLGVASAGQRRSYGRGRSATGASLQAGAPDAAEQPCGLRMLAAQTLSQDLGGRFKRYTLPGVDLRRLNILCVGASRATSHALDSHERLRQRVRRPERARNRHYGGKASHGRRYPRRLVPERLRHFVRRRDGVRGGRPPARGRAACDTAHDRHRVEGGGASRMGG